MAKIEKLKKDVSGVSTTIYPVTIPQGVIDPDSGKSARAEFDEKAAHGYESNPKTLKEVDDSLVQLAGDVNELGIKDAVQGAKIKDIENVLSTANLNQSAQLSVSGRKTVSLSKNAANGGMSVKLEGLTAENLVVNGDFRNGATGFTFETGAALVSVANNVVTFSVNSTSSRIQQMLGGYQNYAGRIMYASAYIDSTKNVSLYLRDGVTNTESQYTGGTGRKRVGLLKTFSASPTADTRIFIQSKTAEVFNVSVSNIMMIDLTDTFGAGNEPDLATCDAMFSDYFEGVKSFVPTGRIRVEDASENEVSRFYLTAPELRSNGTVKDEIRKGANGYELVKRISDIDGAVLATPVVSPISYGGVLNSAENGTVYHEPIIADAGVYGTNMPILLTDYPIASLEEIIIHKDGVDTYLDVSTAVIAGDKLSFTHPSLQSGDLVLFTYEFAKESTNGNITATFYDSNVVKIDTVTGKAYKITDVVTNGVLTRTLTEV